MLLFSLKVTPMHADASNNQSALFSVEVVLQLRSNYCQAVVQVFEKQGLLLKETVGTPVQTTTPQKYCLLDGCMSTVIYISVVNLLKAYPGK